MLSAESREPPVVTLSFNIDETDGRVVSRTQSFNQQAHEALVIVTDDEGASLSETLFRSEATLPTRSPATTASLSHTASSLSATTPGASAIVPAFGAVTTAAVEVPSWEVLYAALTTYDRLIALTAPTTVLPPEPQLTSFHSAVPVPIPLAQYAHALVHNTRAGTYGLALALALMARRSAAVEELPTSLTAHRLFLACLTVAIKACADSRFTNRFMASVGGIDVEDLANMEVDLMLELDWRAIPTASEMIQLPHRLAALGMDPSLTPRAVRCTIAAAASLRSAGSV